MSDQTAAQSKKPSPRSEHTSTDPIEDMLRAALAHHRSGRPQAAASLCQQILRQNPDHADALHLLGVLHAQAGQFAAALPHLVKATRQAPCHAGFLNNYASG